MSAPKKDIVIYDWEILNNPDSFSPPGEFADDDERKKAQWKMRKEMSVSLGVSYHTREKAYRNWTMSNLDEFVKVIEKCDLRVGFNNARFDDELLLALGHPLPLEPSYDIQHELRIAAGIDAEDHSTSGGLKLTQVLYSTIGRDKSKHSGPNVYKCIEKVKEAIDDSEPGRYDLRVQKAIEGAIELQEGCMQDVRDTFDLFLLVANNQPLISPIHGELRLRSPLDFFRPTEPVYMPQPSQQIRQGTL